MRALKYYGYLKGTKLRSRRSYWIIQLISWMFTILWLVVFGYLYLRWDQLPGYAKWGLLALLILTTPDYADLFQSYETYKRRWTETNQEQAEQKF
jgi:hypothetical protein